MYVIEDEITTYASLVKAGAHKPRLLYVTVEGQHAGQRLAFQATSLITLPSFALLKSKNMHPNVY
jgi:hypothetical protein